MNTLLVEDKPAEELSTAVKVKMLSAVAATGCDRDIRLALMLVDASPCPDCDYIRSGCRCPQGETDA